MKKIFDEESLLWGQLGAAFQNVYEVIKYFLRI